MLNGGDAMSAGSNFNVGGGAGGGGPGGVGGAANIPQQGSLSRLSETANHGSKTEIQSGGDAFGFGSLGQVMEVRGRKKREMLKRIKRALPDPARGSSSSVINKTE